MLDYGRNIESFCVLPDEKRLIAGNLIGQLLVIHIDDLRIEREFDAHAGMIIALDAHPTLPYICALGVDHIASVWKHGKDGNLTPIVRANLRLPRPENEHYFAPVTSVSQAIGFHPTERRLLTRTANGAVAEITFDDESFDFSWCRSFFAGCETGYVRYLDNTAHIFVAAGDGTAGVFDVSRREKCLLSYKYNHEQIHAAEHVDGPHYLLPSDSRRVIRLDVTGKTPPIVGPTIVRDHLERIDYNKKSKRAYISSFDRCLYEVSPETGAMLRVVARTPMKCRWLKTLERNPNTMIAQCRNGALYKIDLKKRAITGVLKQTPNALWCGIKRKNSILLAGDGSEVLDIRPNGIDPQTRAHRFKTKWIDLGLDRGFYTKRMSLCGPSQAVLLGRTDGRIYSWNGKITTELVDLGSPLRDIASAPEGHELFAVTEDGLAHKIDWKTGKVLHTFSSPREEPFWSLAYNHNRRLLGVAEREGMLYLLSAEDLALQLEIPNVRRSKRSRWLDDDRLLVVSISQVLEINMNSRTMAVMVPNQRNTIEDFAWSPDKRYLVVVTYEQNITLFDLATRTLMDTVGFDMHYPKGVEWISPVESSYHYEFLVWGRSGTPRHYRVHGTRIFPLGTLTNKRSRVDQQAGVVAL